jgi:hypothetical protein
MNSILSFTIVFGLTLAICILLTRFLLSYLGQVLLDLCRTKERAAFWNAFSSLLLIGFPVVFSLKYQPESLSPEEAVFEILGRLGSNLAVYLIILVGIGFIVSFFALVAPKPKVEAK